MRRDAPGCMQMVRVDDVTTRHVDVTPLVTAITRELWRRIRLLNVFSSDMLSIYH